MLKTRPRRPVIDEYIDYRAFMRDRFDFLKGGPEGFTLQRLADRAGFRSPAYLKMVMDGERNLTEESVGPVAQALELTRSETTCFRTLVELDQSEDVGERAASLRRLARRARFRATFRITPEHIDALRHWYYPVILQLVTTGHVRWDAKRIARLIMPHVTPGEVEEALETLEELGLIEADDEGRLVPTANNLETPDEVAHLTVTAHHHEMSAMAQWALDMVPPANRNFGTVTGVLSKEGLRLLQQRVHDMRHEIYDLMQELEYAAPGGRVVHVNLQTFPLSLPIEKEPDDA